MKKTLSIRGKIATIFTFFPFLAFILAAAFVSLAVYIIQVILKYTGISESLNYLFGVSSEGIKRKKFRIELARSEKRIQENEKSK